MEYGVGMDFNFTTEGEGATCGIYLEIGEEYLLDFLESEVGETRWTAGLCGLTRTWDSVTDHDIAVLQDPSECDIESCAREPCDKFEVCAMAIY